MRNSRCLILILADQAETRIERLLQCLAPGAFEHPADILIIDDASADQTYLKAKEIVARESWGGRVHLLRNPKKQGRGGMQKLGFHFALQHAHDAVVVLDGAQTCSFESIAEVLKPVLDGRAAAVFGSSAVKPSSAMDAAFRGRRFSSRLATRLCNQILRLQLSDYDAELRAYSIEALRAIPFEYNSNDSGFDTEVVSQLTISRRHIAEAHFPTRNAHLSQSRFRRWRELRRTLRSAVQARLQELSLFHSRKFDCAPAPLSQYLPKFDFPSPHSFALERARRGSRVLDLGCGTGYVGTALKQKKECIVTGVDAVPLRTQTLDQFFTRNLNDGLSGVPVEQHDYVLLLDVIEHLAEPEKFMDELRRRLSLNPDAELFISTGNVAFCVTRLMLLLGRFNYGKRGILDMTHTRLFTFASLHDTLEEAGFDVIETAGVPAPFPLALGYNWLSGMLLKVNHRAAKVFPGLFAYQMVIRAKARPTLDSLLRAAVAETETQERSLSALGAVS